MISVPRRGAKRSAAIAGLRAMIRSLGGVLGQGIIVVIMEFAPERTLGLRYAFVGFGLLLLLSLPIVLTIPDSAARCAANVRKGPRQSRARSWSPAVRPARR